MNKQSDPYEMDSLHLSPAEQRDMRARLAAHMEAHPLPVRSPYERLFRLQSGMYRPFAYALAIVLMVGTGTAAAAESALPGDLLYSIKVHVNEPVQGALARTPEAKAAFKVEIAGRRLTETMIIATATTTPGDQDAGKRLSKATHEAEEAIAALEKKDPEAAERAHAHLDASISAHEEMLAYLVATGDEEAKEVFEIYITSKATAATADVNAAAAAAAEAETEASATVEATVTEEAGEPGGGDAQERQEEKKDE